MRKQNKAALRDYILDKVKPEEGNTSWGCCVVEWNANAQNEMGRRFYFFCCFELLC